MSDAPQQSSVVIASPLTWRKATGLHKEMGARSIRTSPLVLAANTPLTLFQGAFGPGTIDRIIGCRLNLGGTNTAGTVILAELISGWTWSVAAAGHLGNYALNIETLTDSATITIESNFGITAAMNAYVALLNFEIPETSMGHYG